MKRLAEFLFEMAKSQIDQSEDQYELQLYLARKEAEEIESLYEKWLVHGSTVFQDAAE